MERTLVLIKPEIIERKLSGEIISVYEKNDFIIDDIKMFTPNISMLEKHYYEHKEKPFYNELIKYMTRGKVIAMILSGENIIQKVRKINGSTNPNEAVEGTIRKLYGTNLTENAVHSSATKEDSIREINIWFK